MKPGESYLFKSDHAECVVLVLKSPEFYEDPPVDSNRKSVKVLILDVKLLSNNPTTPMVFRLGAVVHPYVTYLVEQIGESP